MCWILQVDGINPILKASFTVVLFLVQVTKILQELIAFQIELIYFSEEIFKRMCLVKIFLLEFQILVKFEEFV